MHFWMHPLPKIPVRDSRQEWREEHPSRRWERRKNRPLWFTRIVAWRFTVFLYSVFFSDTDSTALPDSSRCKRPTSLPPLLQPASGLWFLFPHNTEETEQGLHPFSSTYFPSWMSTCIVHPQHPPPSTSWEVPSALLKLKLNTISSHLLGTYILSHVSFLQIFSYILLPWILDIFWKKTCIWGLGYK